MGKVERMYGLTPSPQPAYISYLKKNTTPKLRAAFKAILEETLNVPIRYVVCYNEIYKAARGYCETCSYEETIVEVYFKSSEGKLCKFTYTESLVDLVKRLVAHA